MTESSVPKWLFAHNGPTQLFLIRLRWPRIIFEIQQEKDELTAVEWIDSEELFIEREEKEGRDPAASMDGMLHEAVEFLADSFPESRK